MSKKKLTNREITSVLRELSDNDQILLQNILELKQVFSLYLEYNKDTESFSKFIKDYKVREIDGKKPKHKGGA